MSSETLFGPFIH